MSKRPSTTIARKAQAKAEADFATWLMLAKLGSFDDLSKDAQRWLEGYRTRLVAKVPEAEAMVATIRDLYAAYYAEMGGQGEAPPLAEHVAQEPSRDNVVALKDARAARADRGARPAATSSQSKLPVSPWLIFAAMVALFAVVKFAF
jgi:hypothetical protein